MLIKTRIIPLALVLTLIAPVRAQEAATPLDETTIRATRTPRPVFDAPAMVTQTNAEAPGNALAGDVADLLEFAPGVETTGGPRRLGQKIRIRGYDSESVIVLMDDRRQNFEAVHETNVFVDPSLLKSVEIVRGAASAIYGGGALGGVAVFETKDAADFLAPGQTAGARASFAYRGANREYAPVLTGFARGGEWDALGSFAYRDSGDIKTGNGGKLHTDERLYSGLLKASRTFGGVHTMKLQIQALSDDGREPNNGASAETESNPLVDKEVRDIQYGLKYELDDPGFPLSARLHLYRKTTEVKETDVTPHIALGREQTRELETVGFTADGSSELFGGAHRLSYGFEFYRDDQVGKNSAKADGTRDGVPNAEAQNYGAYLQDEIAFGPVSVIPALRYDRQRADLNAGGERDNGKWSPKASFTFKPSADAIVFGGWSRAFRAPNLTEFFPSGQHFPGQPPVPCPPAPPGAPPCFGQDPDGDGFIFAGFPTNNFVPNPDLKPETVDALEFGIGFNFRDALQKGDRAGFKGAYFHNSAKDFISGEVDIAAGTTTNFNVQDARIVGFELEGWYVWGPASARAGLSLTEAEDENSGAYLSNNVPLTFTADLGFRVIPGGVAGWRGRFARANGKVGRGDAPTPGYGVHDLYFRWTPAENLTVDAGVENALDKFYTRRFASLPEAGRNYALKATYQW